MLETLRTINRILTIQWLVPTLNNRFTFSPNNNWFAIFCYHNSSHFLLKCLYQVRNVSGHAVNTNRTYYKQHTSFQTGEMHLIDRNSLFKNSRFFLNAFVLFCKISLELFRRQMILFFFSCKTINLNIQYSFKIVRLDRNENTISVRIKCFNCWEIFQTFHNV
jgi:hypothetical protein